MPNCDATKRVIYTKAAARRLKEEKRKFLKKCSSNRVKELCEDELRDEERKERFRGDK